MIPFLFTLAILLFEVAYFAIPDIPSNSFEASILPPTIATEFDETSLLIIKKSFSSETYKKGSLVLVESKLVKDYKEGEEVFVYHLDGKGGANIQLGVVGKVYPEQDAITFTNGGTYSSEFIIGTGEQVYSGVGTILSIIESKWGFLFIILVPNFFLFIYQLYSLIVEIKYGKDDE